MASKTWRSGLRWDKAAKRWRDTETGKLLSLADLIRRKALFSPTAPGNAVGAEAWLDSHLGKIVQGMQDAGFAAYIHTHRNADGSVDAEIRSSPARGQDPVLLVKELRQLIQDEMPEDRNIWMAGGARFPVRESEDTEEFKDRYSRYGGMAQVVTYSSRNTTEEAQRSFNLLGTTVLAERLAERGFRKADQVFVRFHWSKDGARPLHGVFSRKKKGR